METVNVSVTFLSLCTLIVLFLGVFIGRALYSLQPGTVNPWATQRMLMHISGQQLPEKIVVTPGSIMYLALIMEELAETIDPVMACMRRSWRLEPAGSAPSDQLDIWHDLTRLAADLDTQSKKVRSVCARMNDFTAYANVKEATDIADGCTDLAVVVCGAALASGVPGAACFAEVGQSNLSKANPITGMIDRDASGKWVKGHAYRAPDLLSVLDLNDSLMSQ